MRVAGIVRMLSRMMGVVLLVVAALAVSAASVVGRAILGARMVRAIAAYAAYTGRASVTALEARPRLAVTGGLEGSKSGRGPAAARAFRSAVSAIRENLAIPVGAVVLQADVVIPASAGGVVLFAHGSGSSRHSPRNQYVAHELQTAGFATVPADPLTVEEERIDARTGTLRFDIGLLGARVTALTDWLGAYRSTAALPVGLFGASTGAAAALVAAAERPHSVAAVVSRGGRPDLAGVALWAVHQPTLLIVGGRDPVVVELNRAAIEKLAGEKRLEIVPGASHLFEEPGALEQVARLAGDWFARHLANQPSPSQGVDHHA